MSIVIVDGPGSPKQPQTKITLYAFRARFTLDEKVAIEEAALTDTLVMVVMKDFDSASYIDLSRPEVREGVGVFVQKELVTEPRAREILTPERAEEILSPIAGESEVPWFIPQ